MSTGTIKFLMQIGASFIFLGVGFSVIPNPEWWQALCIGAASMMAATIYVETAIKW